MRDLSYLRLELEMRRLSLANSYQIRAFTRRSKHVNFTRKTLLHVFMSYDSIVFANYVVFVPKNLKSETTVMLYSCN